MKTIKGPGLFLAQFAGDAAPFNSLPEIASWAGGLGYKGVQIPTWDKRLFDLDTAATSQDYCDDIRGICAEAGLTVTELSTHLQGSSSPSIRPTTPSSTISRHPRCAAIQPPASSGARSRCARR